MVQLNASWKKNVTIAFTYILVHFGFGDEFLSFHINIWQIIQVQKFGKIFYNFNLMECYSRTWYCFLYNWIMDENSCRKISGIHTWFPVEWIIKINVLRKFSKIMKNKSLRRHITTRKSHMDSKIFNIF